MFAAASRLGGAEPGTIPTELIPMNSVQIARGLLNFTVLQTLGDWVLPYWAERQFDPSSPSFTPRSHTGLFLNLTQRNWTAVGSPDCPVEPIVDPRGLLTPFRNGWSIDTWLAVGDRLLLPSRATRCGQRLLDDVPVVETSHLFEGVRLVITACADAGLLGQRMEIRNATPEARRCRLFLAIRPFNPEGVALLHTLDYRADRPGFAFGDGRTVTLSRRPDATRLSCLAGGDAMNRWTEGITGDMSQTVECTSGLANGWAEFDVELEPGATESISATCPLTRPVIAVETTPDPRAAVNRWQARLASGTMIETPDARFDSLVRSSIATLLLLADGDAITPGPACYHGFWFRDAAYMLWALDKTGHADQSAAVIRSFPGRMERSGFFRSQMGEWDSNGQALWTIWQHSILSHDWALAWEMHGTMERAAAWIGRTRLTGRRHAGCPHDGLLPKGLSAEHLGLVDYYY
jgi:hypothetical protein